MRRSAIVLVALLMLASVIGCGGEGTPAPTPSPTPESDDDEMGLSLWSPAFEGGEGIPAEYTCQGQDVSPPLVWAGPPAGTRSFALIVDDSDTPGSAFTHWILFNIPSETREVAEGQLPSGALEGGNDFGGIGYRGPCPPPGPSHHYRFTLYALDQPLDLGVGAVKEQVLDAMQGHILAQAQITGTYQR